MQHIQLELHKREYIEIPVFTGHGPRVAPKIASISVGENICFCIPANHILAYLIHLVLMISNDAKTERIVVTNGVK